MAYTYNAVLLSHKKEWNSDTCHNMGEAWNYYAKFKKSITKKACIARFYLSEISRIGIPQTEMRSFQGWEEEREMG